MHLVLTLNRYLPIANEHCVNIALLDIEQFFNNVNSAGEDDHDMLFVSNKALRIFVEQFLLFLIIFCTDYLSPALEIVAKVGFVY